VRLHQPQIEPGRRGKTRVPREDRGDGQVEHSNRRGNEDGFQSARIECARSVDDREERINA
jgi:hypothetical protein